MLHATCYGQWLCAVGSVLGDLEAWGWPCVHKNPLCSQRSIHQLIDVLNNDMGCPCAVQSQIFRLPLPIPVASVANFLELVRSTTLKLFLHASARSVWYVVVIVTRRYGKHGLDNAVTSLDCTQRDLNCE